jgi:hypothetical protein
VVLVTSGNREYNFRAESTKDCQSWLTTLRMAKTSAVELSGKHARSLEAKINEYFAPDMPQRSSADISPPKASKAATSQSPQPSQASASQKQGMIHRFNVILLDVLTQRCPLFSGRQHKF